MLTTIYIALTVIAIISILLFFKLKNKLQKFLFGTLICICIIITCIISYQPLLDKINYGLDLQGGFEVLYKVSPIDKKKKLDSDMLYNTYKSLLNIY